MDSGFFNTAFGRIDRWRDDRLVLACDCSMTTHLGLQNAAGCPCVLFTLANKGKRIAKIKSFIIALRGEGFLALFQQGFSQPFGYTPHPSDKEEELQVSCPALDKPNHEHGWVLQRDDVVRFFYPVRCPPSMPFATGMSDKLVARTITFAGDEIDVVDGEQIQGILRPALDLCISNNLVSHVRMNISIKVISSTPPALGPVGQVNQSFIPMPDFDPNPSDFAKEADDGTDDSVRKIA